MKMISYLRSRNLVPIVAIYFSVGVAGMILPATRELFKDLTPLSLLMSFALVLLHHERFDTRFWLVSLFVFAAGVAVEAVGTATGLIFGEYSYGGTLGPKIFDTPLIIGINWLMLVYCSLYITGRFIEHSYFRVIAASALMVIYDFALEPAAIYLDMWNWGGGPVPLQNYIAWFVIAFVFNWVGERFRLTPPENKLAAPLFFIQLLFFILLDIWIFAERIWG